MRRRLSLFFFACAVSVVGCSSKSDEPAANAGGPGADAGLDAAAGSPGSNLDGGSDAADAALDAPDDVVDAATDAPADGPTDGPTPGDAMPPDDCVIHYVAKKTDCAESCEARLSLPTPGAFCTQTCSKDAECALYDPGLVCAADTGTCMWSCIEDAACVALGLPRCHPVGHFCDTLPPCDTNAQCVGVGYTKCVKPGAYCE